MNKLLNISGIAGIAGVFLAFLCVLLAVISYSQFSWTNNALSDLGVQGGITAPLFNIGLVLSGFLFLIFAMGLFIFIGKYFMGKVGAVVFGLSCIMLVAIGVFNENFRPTHYVVSVGLFVFLPISLLIMGAAFWIDKKIKLSILTIVLAIFAAVVWVLEFIVHYVEGVAVPEFVSGLAGAIWVFVLSWLMLRQKLKVS